MISFPKKSLFIIDGSSFLYRAYYSMRPLHTAKGRPIHAVYGFCRMIKKLIDTAHPEYMVLAWDSKSETTTRHEIYAEYKATRQAPPSDMFEQKELILEFADMIDLEQVAQSGIEADDLMYSLTLQFSKDLPIVLVTSDKDMGQVLSDQVYLFDPFKEQVYDKATFEAEKELPVSKLPFYYALLGDASDNIPGVSGVGKKTAMELVKQFDSLDDMYARIEQVSSARIREKLLDQREKAELSLQLFLLRRVPLKVTLQDLAFDANNWNKARPLFEELQFKSLLKGMETTAAATAENLESKIAALSKEDLRLVTTKEELAQMIAELRNAGECACDTETDGRPALDCSLVGISFAADARRAYYIPVGHQTNDPQLPRDYVIEQLKPFFADKAMKFYFHHAKFDEHVLSQYGIQVAHTNFDSLIAASLVTKDWQRAGLKYLSLYYLNEQMISFEEVIKPQKLKNFSYVSTYHALYYAANDSRQTWRLVPIMRNLLKTERMEDLYNNIELPLLRVLYRMEQIGIHVDTKALSGLRQEVVDALQKTERKICEYAGVLVGSINLNSPRQLAELLFEKMGLVPVKKSASGAAYSTDIEVLEELAPEHPIARELIRYRELSKLLSTYIDGLPQYINPRTGNIHTTYNQFAVATGRLASSDPNLQNIPAATEGFGARIRAAFVPPQGQVFISGDYSQIELRVLAFLSQDTNLLDAFKHNRDIHTETAAGIFGIPRKDVTSDQRQLGKRINFSILYGMTPYGLSKDLGISFADAKRYIEGFFAAYPAVQRWMERVIAEVEQHGYVTTYWGRRRYIPQIHERNRVLYEEARRVAINTVGQGTAAEIMKQGMIALDARLQKEIPEARILLQIHDELLISVPQEHAESAQTLMKEVLEAVVNWNIPLQVTTHVGNNWGEV